MMGDNGARRAPQQARAPHAKPFVCGKALSSVTPPDGPAATTARAPARPLTILLASPRGFCAGVDRAIQIVERAWLKWGAPVYVRHEIVHNRHVVERLQALGAVLL